MRALSTRGNLDALSRRPQLPLDAFHVAKALPP